jgi:hypothetical protein
VALVLNLREAWQEMEFRGPNSSEAPTDAVSSNYLESESTVVQPTASSWAA